MPAERFIELYSQYGPAVYVRCRALLGDPVAAEDATQETFLRVYRHLEGAPDTATAFAWIYRIATNYCLNEIRDRRLRAEPRDQLPDGVGHEIEEMMQARDLAERLIARSPEACRTAAWLHHVDGLDQGEVARVLGVSRRTVGSRIAEFARLARKMVGRSAA